MGRRPRKGARVQQDVRLGQGPGRSDQRRAAAQRQDRRVVQGLAEGHRTVLGHGCQEVALGEDQSQGKVALGKALPERPGLTPVEQAGHQPGVCDVVKLTSTRLW